MCRHLLFSCCLHVEASCASRLLAGECVVAYDRAGARLQLNAHTQCRFDGTGKTFLVVYMFRALRRKLRLEKSDYSLAIKL